jgi:hypothetical protein
VHKDFGIDTWYYLLYANGFRKNKRLPVNIPFYLLDEEDQFYPPGFPILLSIFPPAFLQRFHWLINPVIDSLQVILLYIFTLIISSNLIISIFAALLYISSPILITQSSNLNSRMFGSLILTVILLNIYAFLHSSNILFFFLCILFGIILSFSHKMSMQQLVFLVLGLSIFTLKSFYFLIFFLIFLSSLLLGRKFYLGLLHAHAQIIKFWSKNMPFLGAHQIYDSSLYKGLKKATEMKCVKGLRSSKFCYTLEKIRIGGIFFLTIWLFFLPRNIKNLNLDIIFYWIIINYFTLFSTSYLPGLKNLGEGYKYLTYGVFPISFFLSYYSFMKLATPYHFILMGIILTMNLMVSSYIIRVQSKNILAQTDKALLKIFDGLKRLDEDRIMCLPFSKCDAVAYFTKKKVLFGGHSLGWEKLNAFWPVIKKSIEYFIDEYKIDYILIDDRYVNFDDLNLKINYKTIDKQGNYILMKVNR